MCSAPAPAAMTPLIQSPAWTALAEQQHIAGTHLRELFARDRRRFDQAENDEPQPQVVVAFGFLITNCAPSMSSL